MANDVDRLVDDVVGSLDDAPRLSEVEEDDTITVYFNWFNHPRRDTAGFSISMVFGVDSEVWLPYLEENVEPYLDKRKLKTTGTSRLGTITFNGKGAVVSHETDPEFLKPLYRDEKRPKGF